MAVYYIISSQMLTVRRIKVGEWRSYRQIRLASLKDSPESFSTTYQAALERATESWIEQADYSAEGLNRSTFLAFDSDKPVGVAALYRDQDHKDAGELIQVWVSPEHRGSGVAGQLIQSTLAWAKESGISQIRTEVLDTNKRAIQFYERIGFKVADPTPSHSHSGVVLELQA